MIRRKVQHGLLSCSSAREREKRSVSITHAKGIRRSIDGDTHFVCSLVQRWALARQRHGLDPNISIDELSQKTSSLSNTNPYPRCHWHFSPIHRSISPRPPYPPSRRSTIPRTPTASSSCTPRTRIRTTARLSIGCRRCHAPDPLFQSPEVDSSSTSRLQPQPAIRVVSHPPSGNSIGLSFFRGEKKECQCLCVKLGASPREES